MKVIAYEVYRVEYDIDGSNPREILEGIRKHYFNDRKMSFEGLHKNRYVMVKDKSGKWEQWMYHWSRSAQKFLWNRQ